VAWSGQAFCATARQGGRFSFPYLEKAMSERELYRQISRATGESVERIAGMGFMLDQPNQAEPEPQAIDWDELQARRRVALMPQRPEVVVA
jgi:hypothetical protein